jgi:hypothetical protein
MNNLATVALASLTAAACTVEPTDTGTAQVSGDAEQQLSQSAKADGPSSSDKRILNCQLEYESFTPFATQPIDSFDKTIGQIVSGGVTATDGTYQLGISINPAPAYNLSFNVQLSTVATGEIESYVVLPSPHVGGAYLFELGTHIPAVTAGGGTFDYLRAYCSIRNP